VDAPFKSLAVANRFIEIGKESGSKDLTLMKLLKLVYFAHGWHLALADRPLIDEQLEAWKFGPVAPEVYNSFRGMGSEPIRTPVEAIVNFNMDSLDEPIKFETPMTPSEPRLEAFFKKIWDVYGKWTAYQLSELTHQPGTPWHTVWYERGGSTRKHTDIPDDIIAA